jgi:hypothetical protein
MIAVMITQRYVQVVMASVVDLMLNLVAIVISSVQLNLVDVVPTMTMFAHHRHRIVVVMVCVHLDIILTFNAVVVPVGVKCWVNAVGIILRLAEVCLLVKILVV